MEDENNDYEVMIQVFYVVVYFTNLLVNMEMWGSHRETASQAFLPPARFPLTEWVTAAV